MSRRSLTWVVDIATDDNDPYICGPYTQAKAEELAAKFNDRIDSSQFGYIYATAHPIPKLSGITALLAEFGQAV